MEGEEACGPGLCLCGEPRWEEGWTPAGYAKGEAVHLGMWVR